MSANLGNSAKLYDDVDFRNRVRAAMVEVAAGILGTGNAGTDIMGERILSTKFAVRVVADADAYVANFTRLAADNASISASDDPSAATDEDIRFVVTGLWSAVAASVPGL